MRPPLCLGLCMQACLRDMTRTEAFVWCRSRPSKWASFVRRARSPAIDVAALPNLLADCRAAWVSSLSAWLSVRSRAAETAAETAPEAQ